MVEKCGCGAREVGVFSGVLWLVGGFINDL